MRDCEWHWGVKLGGCGWRPGGVFGGYSGVFGWFSGYSAHLDRLMMWQLIGSGYVQVRPSTTLYNIKGVYQELGALLGRAGVQGSPTLLEFYHARFCLFLGGRRCPPQQPAMATKGPMGKFNDEF